MYEFTPADPTIKRGGGGGPGFLTEKRKILFVFIPVIALVGSVTDVVLAGSQVIGVVNLASAVVLAVLGLMWVKADAREHSYELSQYYALAVVLAGIFAIVYYLVRSRGFVGGLRATGLMVLYLLALVVAVAITSGIIAIVLVTLGVLPKSTLGT